MDRLSEVFVGISDTHSLKPKSFRRDDSATESPFARIDVGSGSNLSNLFEVHKDFVKQMSRIPYPA